MNFKKFATEKAAAAAVAQELISAIKAKPDLNIVFPTGASPMEVLNYLVEDHQKNQTDWSKARIFGLEEFINLPIDHPRTCWTWMNKYFFEKVNVDQANVFYPVLDKNYDDLIAQYGGIDFQLLGIGLNGHVAVNEPGSPLDSWTRLVDLNLTEERIEANANLYFNGDRSQVPTQILTMGLASILQAKKIILLIFGASKKDALSQLKTFTSFDINFPASALTQHPNADIVYDALAEA